MKGRSQPIRFQQKQQRQPDSFSIYRGALDPFSKKLDTLTYYEKTNDYCFQNSLESQNNSQAIIVHSQQASSKKIKSNNKHSCPDYSIRNMKKQSFPIPIQPLVQEPNKRLLLLDLDETLIHCSHKPFFPVSDITLRISINSKRHTIFVAIRPGVVEFLAKLSQVFDIGVFTAGVREVIILLSMHLQ